MTKQRIQFYRKKVLYYINLYNDGHAISFIIHFESICVILFALFFIEYMFLEVLLIFSWNIKYLLKFRFRYKISEAIILLPNIISDWKYI